ncbi:hypothetical protein H310_05966 [Aphanomyces invadans]|uniref:EF-hand domain-containing protein n=1 Tax=Aphanomyces invadans TaxID=157072 RepID=A0A024U9B5_9STRA|nr:hypothetical protein H310_05966 [Aphanomyces invadans]ETW02457.1 hypothetical protein H310_05966 [Aphanomyces invadans]|eukprot:XP_008869062.1 hypothetical protein H310_05966 [Aphanomyces invadans]
MAPATPSRRAFHNDTRNFGGRVAVYDELINHQMKLLSINPQGHCGFGLASAKTSKPGIVSLRRRRPPTPIAATDLSARLSRNRKSAVNTTLVDHQNEIKVMMHKILHYSKRQSIDNVQKNRLPPTPAKHNLFNGPLKDGFGIPRQIDGPIHDEAKRRLHAIHAYRDEDIHNDKVGIRSVRSIRSAPSKSPRTQIMPTNHINVLLLTLQLYLTEHRISVLELFGQADRAGDGSVCVSKLRSILFHMDLGWTQHDITLLVRAMDPEETGVILPITVETLLRKLQQPHLGCPSIAPQPSVLLRRLLGQIHIVPAPFSPSTSLYGRRVQDLKKAFASPRVKPWSSPNQTSSDEASAT